MRDQAWLDDDEQRRQFRRIMSMLSRFREQDSEMPVQQMLVFCWIALNEGGLQRDMCDALAIPVSTASRNVAALSEVHRLGKPGLGLVTWTESKQDRRAKLLGLTSTGKMFARSLLSAVDRA